MKRSKFISKIRFPGADIKIGQEWIRKANSSQLNNPFIIKIESQLDPLGSRFETSSKRGLLFFDREDIVTNYDLRIKIKKEYSIDEQIAEIKGLRMRRVRDNTGDVRIVFVDSSGQTGEKSHIPSYSTSINDSDPLLVDLKPYQPIFKTKMSSFELSLIINGRVEHYKEKTRPMAICMAYLNIFG